MVTSSEQYSETKQVTARLVDQLLFLVNPENELAHLDVPGPVRLPILPVGCILWP